MGGLLVTFGIIVVMSVLGYLTQALKRAADRRQQEQDRERDRERRARAARENPEPIAPTNRNDLDRYIRAVEAQRQKPVPTARPAAGPTPVPTVQPARKKAKREDVPTAFPAAKRGKGTPAPVVVTPDDLPVATVVTPRGSVPTAAPAQRPEKAATLTQSRSTKSDTPVGRRLAALFASGDAVALAVVLHEVLGPPKCKQGGGGSGGSGVRGKRKPHRNWGSVTRTVHRTRRTADVQAGSDARGFFHRRVSATARRLASHGRASGCTGSERRPRSPSGGYKMPTVTFDFRPGGTGKNWTMGPACGTVGSPSVNPAPSTHPGIYIIHNSVVNSTYVGYAADAEDRWSTRYEVFHIMGIPKNYGDKILCAFCIPTVTGNPAIVLKGQDNCEHLLIRAVSNGLLGPTTSTNSKLATTPFVHATVNKVVVYLPTNLAKWGKLEAAKQIQFAGPY